MSTEGTPTTAEWEQRFDAVARLYREANDKLETDPLSAALRARQAIEHIADYLHTREIGPAARNEMLDAKLKRIDAKLVFPRLVATHFGSVQIHTNSVIHPGTMSSDPDPNLLRPCMLSLAIVVDWFFKDYLKRTPPTVQAATPRVPAPAPPIIPDATPVNSTIATMINQGTRFGTGIGEFIPIWRTTATASTLRLEAEGDMSDQRIFKLEDRRTYFIGRTEQRSDGSRNDFALPKAWNSISRDQGTLTLTPEGDVILKNTSTNNNVFVRGESVPKGTARALRHGDAVQLGRCVGMFSDGRYYASAPAAAVDTRTGLLSRLGLVAEISGALAIGKPRTLVVVRCPESTIATEEDRDPERVAATVALAIHRELPSIPLARTGMDIATILPNPDGAKQIAAIADRTAGAHCTTGYIALTGAADQAMPRLEACLGALSRVAIAGRELAEPEDLTRYALTPTPLDELEGRVRPLFELGGGAILFVLDELERLRQLAPQAVPVLELELVEMLGARMGPRDVVAFAGPGSILFATAGDAERFAHELSVAWHARGPVTANALEIDRALSAHLLAQSDLDGLPERAALLAEGEHAGLGASALPGPIALAARAIDDARTPLQRLRALVQVTEVTWKLLAFILVAAARGVAARPVSDDAEAAWPAPWRALARDAARRLDGQQSRISELAAVVLAADRDPALRDALGEIAAAAQVVARVDPASTERSLPRIEKAVRELFGRLGPLRGWTLVGVEQAEFVDVDGLAQRVEYVDYTGPSARGSLQRITVMGFRGLGRFAYLVRWNEGLAIALEPFVRRVRDEATGDTALVLALAPVDQPGPHRYGAMGSANELELPVTVKQLGYSRP